VSGTDNLGPNPATNVIENGVRIGIMDKFKMTGGRHDAGPWAGTKAFRIIAGRARKAKHVTRPYPLGDRVLCLSSLSLGRYYWL